MAPRFQHGLQNDVFISYTHTDDALDATERHWVSTFEEDITTRIAQVSGRSVVIWRDVSKLEKADRFDAEIARQVRQSAVLVTILSPGYFTSTYCREERELFRQAAPDIGNKARIVKVAKTHVDRTRYPEDLVSLDEHRFYVEKPPGRFREFHMHPDETVRALYATVVDDVAQETSKILQLLEPGASAPAATGTVFLAETSSDLEDQRSALRRSLVQRGYEVLPKAPLRLLSGRQLQTSLQADLERAKMSIHPVGAFYGTIPEGGGDVSLIRIQLEHAAQDRRNGEFPRMVWIPEGLEVAEPPQVAFLQQIRKRWAGNPFQVIEGSFQKFETDLLDSLGRERPALAARKRPSVYVLCEGDEDRKAARNVRVYLNGRDFDVGSATATADKHLRRLAEDDAFLVYWGRCGDDWVYDRVAEVAEPVGRTKPVFGRAVFLADPNSLEKEEFLAHDVDVIQGYEPPPPDVSLAQFVDQVRSGWSRRNSAGGGL